MRADGLIQRLESNGETLRRLIEKTPAEQVGWRPRPEAWSILEVTAHLLDEEREDFRVRLDLTLRDPAADWPPIDPQGWVAERKYAERDLQETLASFVQERDRSIRWLRGLASPDWNQAHPYPKLRPMTAGELLGAWVAHDLLHLRQLTGLHYAYVQALAGPHPLEYAGEW